jgi:hypothetical protein
MGAPEPTAHHILLRDAASQLASLRKRIDEYQNPAGMVRAIYNDMDVTMALEHMLDAELRFIRAAGDPPR